MGVAVRLIPAAILVVMVMGLTMACSSDPSPSSTEGAGATPAGASQATVSDPEEQPTSAVAASESSEESETAGNVSTVAPSPTESQTGSASAASEPSEERERGSLRVTGTSSMAIPSSGSDLRLSGWFSHSSDPAQPSVPTEGGLTVSAIGSVTVEADEAYVVIVPEQRYGPSGPEQMTDDDRADIKEGLAELGISEESVEFSHIAVYGPSSISVEVSLDEFDEIKDQIVDAVEEVIRRSESYGVVYTLTAENCESALSRARREAIPSAERAADDLSEALVVERGGVIGALEYPLVNNLYGRSLLDIQACGSQMTAPYPNLMPFDADPEVEVTVGLQITYAID